MTSSVEHPTHYNAHPSGVECITVCSRYDFCLGSAYKYLFRHGLKGNSRQDIEKAKWLLQYLLGAVDTLKLAPVPPSIYATRVIAVEPNPVLRSIFATIEELAVDPDSSDRRYLLTKAISETESLLATLPTPDSGK